MNKKGFTLIEIIIAIALISLIGTGSILSVKKLKDNKNELKEITNRIIESASVYIENEKDTNGNTYINGINEGGQGLILPLEVLHDKGYVNDKDYNYVIKKISNDKRYVVIGYKTEDECKTGGVEINVNWNDKEVVTSPLYLCSYTKNPSVPQNPGGTSIPGTCGEDKKNTILNVILRDNLLNLGIPDLDNYKDEDKGLYILPDDDGSSFYFYGKTKNNYIKFNDKMWRIVRVNGNGSTRIVLDDVIPYKLQKANLVCESEGNCKVVPTENEYYEDTLNKKMLCFKMKSGSWSLICFYDMEYETGGIAEGCFYPECAWDVIKTYKFNNNYNVINSKYLEDDLPDSLYASKEKYNQLIMFSESLKDNPYIKQNETYYINDDHIYSKRDFTFEDNKKSERTFTNGIQTIGYKELKYSGGTNSYLTDTNSDFYTSDYEDGYSGYFYYNSTTKTIGVKYDFGYRFTGTGRYSQYAGLFLQNGFLFGYSQEYKEDTLPGFKPVVNLKEDTCFKGNGTQENPYEITECNQ